MKKIFSLFAIMLVAVVMHANTPYKNLYITAKIAPTGAGQIYLGVKPGEEDFIRAQSEEGADEAFIQATIGENGNEGTTYGVNSKAGVYEVNVYVEPAAGYELVCLSNKVKESGVYYPEDCYAVFDGYDSGSRHASFDYSGIEYGFLINANNELTHPQIDGNSSDGPSRDVCFADESKWSPEPDTEIYAIMRKKGDSYPKLDLSEKPDYADNTTDISTKDNAIHSYTIFCRAGSQLTLPVCMKNHGTEVAGVQFTMEPSGTQLETATEYKPSGRAGALDVFTMNVAESKLQLAAFSTEANKVEGEDGDIVAVTLYVPEDAENGNYDIKFNNVVLATPDGKAVKCDDTTVSIIVGPYDIPDAIEAVEATPATGRIFRITGVEVISADDPGLYIQDGKKFIVR